RHVPAITGSATALAGQVGGDGEGAQLPALADLHRAQVAVGVRLDVERLAVDPQLRVNRAGPLAEEGEVALVSLGEDLIGRTLDIDLRRQAVFAGDALHDIGIAHVFEGASAARHAHVLEAVL